MSADDQAAIVGRLYQLFQQIVHIRRVHTDPFSNPIKWEFWLGANGAGAINYDFEEQAGWDALAEAEAAVQALYDRMRERGKRAGKDAA